MAERQWGPRIKNHHVSGNVGTDPEIFAPKGGKEQVRFRLAAEQFRFDRDSGQDVKDDTVWYTVKIPADRKLAQHVMQSLHKGDFVNVKGTFTALAQARITEDGTAQVGVTNYFDANDVSPSLRMGAYRQLTEKEVNVLAQYTAQEQAAEQAAAADAQQPGWEPPAAPIPQGPRPNSLL